MRLHYFYPYIRGLLRSNLLIKTYFDPEMFLNSAKASFLVVTVISFSFLLGCSSEKEKFDGKRLTNEQRAKQIENISFETLDGEEISISEFRGKVVMIDFWETWCKPCLAAFPSMQKALNEYPDDFVVLAVTPGFMNSRDDARQFKENNNFDFHFLWDEQQLHQKLQVQGIPYKIFVDAEGKYIKSKMGVSGNEQQEYEKLKSVIEEHKSSP